jgi:hypothetical protein
LLQASIQLLYFSCILSSFVELFWNEVGFHPFNQNAIEMPVVR